MGLEENEEMCKILMSKMDEKYGNLYDNYQNISKTIPEEDLRYTGSDFGGYFGNKGIYN